MKKNMKLVVLTLTVALVFGGSWLLASEEIAKSENLAAPRVMTNPGSKLLTDKGKYFETVRSMEGSMNCKQSSAVARTATCASPARKS